MHHILTHGFGRDVDVALFLHRLQVACGSGLELIYEFLLSDDPGNRQGLLEGRKPLVRAVHVHQLERHSLSLNGSVGNHSPIY